ncbi:hypothetical protein ACET3Z_007712 [Daucus carota]
MDKYRKHNYTSLPVDNKRYTSRGERDQNPSFSSTLLDQIYRSIDENNDHRVAVDDEVVLSRETVTIKKKKQYIYKSVEKKEAAHFQRIEKNKASDNIYQRKNGEKYGGLMTLNSSWSSSDSSSGGLFSEADSNYGVSSLYAHRPKPIRTSTEKISHEEKRKHKSDSVVKRSKLKALKIYGDLKNVKQPISPGAKLASFLNSLFSARENTKKGKFSGPNSSTASACSASRSCLSKTPSTREKLSDSAAKKSVRFYHVSVSMDKDSQLQRGKIRGNDSEVPDQRNRVNDEVMYDIRRKNQRVEERTRELLQNYARKVESESEEDEDEDDDDASYASSDLFELDSLNNCGINVRGNYMEELPVYETTYLHANLLALQTN